MSSLSIHLQRVCNFKPRMALQIVICLVITLISCNRPFGSEKMNTRPPQSWVELIQHPKSSHLFIQSLEVSVTSYNGSDCRLSYRLQGEIDKLLIPDPQPSNRITGLWNHTCFEMFVGSADEPGYLEFNFSPSGEWAVFSLLDYRKPGPAPAFQTPVITTERKGNSFTLFVDIHGISIQNPKARIGFSAVLEDKNSSHSYWAISHHSEVPDFHNKADFYPLDHFRIN